MTQAKSCSSCSNDAKSKCRECKVPLCYAHENHCQLYCLNDIFCKKHILECEKCDGGFGFMRCEKCNKRFVHDHDE